MAIKAIVSSNLPVRACLFPLIKSSMPPSNNPTYSGVPLWAFFEIMTIGDYVILMSYYLKLLQMPNSEILAFIEEFEHITETYRSEVNPAVASIVIHPDLTKRMEILKNYI